MPTIPLLSRASSVTGGDLVPVYINSQSDVRAASMTTMLEYFDSNSTIAEAAAASAASAAASAAQALDFAGPKFDTIAAMAAADVYNNGDFVLVWQAYKNTAEFFEYDSNSVLTADGALVVDATGMGVGRLISTRTDYESPQELEDDPRAGLNPGAVYTSGNFSYQVLAPGTPSNLIHLTTAGGVLFKMLPLGDGSYSFAQINPFTDGVTDNLAKLNTFLNIIDRTVGVYNYGPKIHFPSGLYYFSDTINLKSVCTLAGDYTGFNNADQTEFIFADDVAGIIVNRGNTLGAATTPTFDSGADGSEISGILLRGGRGALFDETKSGIWLRARAKVINCGTIDFAGHGIYAAAGSNGVPYIGNCNLFWVEHIYSETNRGSGFHSEGIDANAGTCIRINAKGNDMWGVYEGSLLRNHHANHHATDNTLGSYISTNTSSLIAAYAEDGATGVAHWGGPQLGCSISANNKVADLPGPTKAAGVAPILVPEFANGPRGLKNDNGGFVAVGQDNLGGSAVTAHLGTDNISIVYGFHATYSPATPWRILYVSGGRDVATRNGSSATEMCRYTGGNTTLTFGRGVATPDAMMMPRMWVGLNDGARHHTTGVSAPTSGTWARGDIIWASNGGAGGKAGWFTTTGGVAGSTAVFKQFGAIDA